MPDATPLSPYGGPLVSKHHAVEAGLDRYFEAAECMHGHIAQRAIKTGRCLECMRLTRNGHAKKYRDSHRGELRKKWRVVANNRRLADAGLVVRAMENRKAKKQRLEEALAGRAKADTCEICGDNNLRIVFDHDHATMEFRGWICDRCNKTLGHVKDDPELLFKLAEYLTYSRRLKLVA